MKRGMTTARAQLFLFTFAFTLFAQTPPEVPKPGPEHQRLHYYVGDWKVEAEAKPSPFGPGGKITSIDHNEMLGDFFVVFHSDSQGPRGKVKGVSFMGYDPKKKVYTYDFANSMGEHDEATGMVSGDTWTWTFAGEGQGKSFKGRFTLREDSPTSYSFTNELSIDSGPWTKLEEGKVTKIK